VTAAVVGTKRSVAHLSVDGLTAKVLSERLRKLIRYGIVEREVFAEVPTHVEYRLTAFGARFSGVLEQIEKLQNSLE
jgi:DNA-binding HxlR family transcriptional regulator